MLSPHPQKEGAKSIPGGTTPKHRERSFISSGKGGEKGQPEVGKKGAHRRFWEPGLPGGGGG